MGLSLNQILNNLITLTQTINCKTKLFIKHFHPQLVFTIQEAILIPNILNLKWLLKIISA